MDIFTTIAMGAVRGFLCHIIGKFTPEELETAIKTDFDLWSHTSESIRDKADSFKHMWGKLFDKYYDQITTELIIEWLRQDLPQLHKVIISSPEGQKWLDRQVTIIKAAISGCKQVKQ